MPGIDIDGDTDSVPDTSFHPYAAESTKAKSSPREARGMSSDPAASSLPIAPMETA